MHLANILHHIIIIETVFILAKIGLMVWIFSSKTDPLILAGVSVSAGIGMAVLYKGVKKYMEYQ